MIPGLGSVKQRRKIQEGFDERELAHVEAIIKSMTAEERRNSAIINGSRRKRIAMGSGATVQDVNRLLKQYEQTKKLFKQLSDGAAGKAQKAHKMKQFKLPF